MIAYLPYIETGPAGISGNIRPGREPQFCSEHVVVKYPLRRKTQISQLCRRLVEQYQGLLLALARIRKKLRKRKHRMIAFRSQNTADDLWKVARYTRAISTNHSSA